MSQLDIRFKTKSGHNRIQNLIFYTLKLAFSKEFSFFIPV